jgi:Glycosyl transferase family 2
MQPLCLNMIVKNESPVIERCLASVRPWITHWVVVDTGSTDGTQDLVRQALAGLPGELHERPWKNFAHNRNEALDLALPMANGGYVLFIDADETLHVEPGFQWPKLSSPGYRFDCIYGDTRYQRNALIQSSLPWRWTGVIHEYLDCSQPHSWAHLLGPRIVVQHDGARARDPQTYLRDIAVLQQGLIDEPTNTRYMFYLAQSHKDAGQFDEARQRYLQRAAAGGWEEERWTAQYRAAQMGQSMGLPIEIVRSEFLQAWQARPTRAEPLHDLARMHRLRDEFALAELFARQAMDISLPSDILFVDQSVYDWRCLDEYAVACFWSGKIDAGRVAMRQILDERKFPISEMPRMMANKLHFKLD